MSELIGLSVLSQDPDNSGANSEDTKFLSLQYDSSNEERVFIAGTAYETSYDASTEQASTYYLTSVAHGKFSKLSFVQENRELDSLNPVARDDTMNFTKGPEHYLHVNDSGEIVTNSLEDAFKDLEFEQITLVDKSTDSRLTLAVNAGQLEISNPDADPEDSVAFTLEQLKDLKQLLTIHESHLH